MEGLPATRQPARATPLRSAGRRALYYRFTEARPASPRLGPMAQSVGHSPKGIPVGPTRFVDDLPFKRPGTQQ
jgi:hypothetical protein